MNQLDLNIRFDTSGDAGEFSGHAAVFGERNAHGEIVQRGAFARSLAQHQRAGTKPLMLYAHDQTNIIGTWTEIREDDTGLFVAGKIITSIRSGMEAYERLRAGAMNGLSIGFRIPEGGEKRSNGTRMLMHIDLAEVSIVGLPSAGKARITQIRNGRISSAAAFISACQEASRSIAKGK